MKEKWVPLQDGPLVINGISPILMGNCSYNFPNLLTGGVPPCGIIRPINQGFSQVPEPRKKNPLTFQVYWLLNRCSTLPYIYIIYIHIHIIPYTTRVLFMAHLDSTTSVLGPSDVVTLSWW